MTSVGIRKTVAEVRHGTMRCVFRKKGPGWVPDWFYLGKRRMLRFKDHEWVSVSALRPALTHVRRAGDAGLRFEGTLPYYNETVSVSVAVSAAGDGPGFVVESCYTPLTGPIEIFESGTSFECPYEYDFTEDSTTILGMNPVYKHRNGRIISGLYLENPLWVCNRKLRARQTGPCWSPLLAHRVLNLDGANERCIMVLGHWDDCTFRDLYATPTRGGGNVSASDEEMRKAERDRRKRGERRGYKYLVGCSNWSSSPLKDPNFIVRRGQTVRQKVTVDYASDLGQATLDAWLIAGWQRMMAYTFPHGGRVRAHEIAKGLGVDWKRAADELASMFPKKRFANVWSEDEGIQIYLDGSRPVHLERNKQLAFQWYGPLNYRAKLLGDTRLRGRVYELAERHSEAIKEIDPSLRSPGAIGFVCSPVARLLQHADPRPKRVERYARRFLTGLMRQMGRDTTGACLQGDYGSLALVVEGLLVASSVFDSIEMRRYGLGILKTINRQADGEFWRFGCGPSEGWCQAGRQIRAAGFGRAILANLQAAKLTGDARYLDCARRFANYMLAIAYATWNASPVDDMDTRGYTAGGTCGRDQLAEMPPWETFEGIRGVAAILNKVEPLPCYYDVIFLAARSGLCSLPAARTRKRVYEPDGNRVYVDLDRFPNERTIYMRAGFIAYECPWDQTMQAPYQAVEPLLNHLVFGGGLANVADDRLLAVVPGAAHYEYEPGAPCEAHVWNPTKRAIRSALTFQPFPNRAVWRMTMPDGQERTGKGAREIPICVPARACAKVVCASAGPTSAAGAPASAWSARRPR